ncbi:MAG: HAD family hydrolase [Spirochaetaceae bacterium]
MNHRPPEASLYIFDVDHTLARRSTARRFAELGRKQGFITLRSLLTLPFHYARYRLGILESNDVKRPLAPLTGLTEERLDALGEESFELGTRGDLFPEMEELLRELRRQGREVLLASTSFRFLLEPLARYLGATGLVCSELEISQGIATGEIDGEPCYGEEKARRTAAYCKARGIDLGSAAFYSDSHHDLPLLTRVATPVVVNPDLRLRLTAHREGWPILSPA